MRALSLAVVLLSLCFARVASSQQIRIVVLDAHQGKPVRGECLNISLGPWHGTDIYAPTNENGMAVLNLDLDAHQVSAVPVPSQTCNGLANAKPVQFAKPLTSLSVLPNWYVSCEASKELMKSQAWRQLNPSERIPTFAVQDIIAKGLVAVNSCSKLNVAAKPGELVIVVRKMGAWESFWEGMKS